MALINFSKKSITFKLVYWGPDQSGKYTNLKNLHEQIPSEDRGELTFYDQASYPSNFFELTTRTFIHKFSTRFQIYTFPGDRPDEEHVGKMLLNSDGIIFVADTVPDRLDENLYALDTLKQGLREMNQSIEEIPFVVQLNKCDLTTEQDQNDMVRFLQTEAYDTVKAVATERTGVYETFEACTRLILRTFTKRNNLGQDGEGDGSLVPV